MHMSSATKLIASFLCCRNVKINQLKNEYWLGIGKCMHMSIIRLNIVDKRN
jgi:hypothetical protein